MPQSIDEWSDQHWDRAFARQTAQVDTAKLIVTFSLLVAATFVATALLGPPTNGLDVAASIVILLAFVVTGLILVWLDRLQWPNREDLLNRQQRVGWDDNALLAYIRDVHRD